MSLWTINFQVSTNEDWRDNILLVTDLGESSEAAFDLSGSSLLMHLRQSPEAQRIDLLLSTDNGRIVIDDPSTGLISFDVAQETVEGLNPGVYFHDIVWTMADDRKVNLASGTVTVDLGVTRDDN
ncbi:hypothetical protein [Shinella granuli]|uniref:Uncharacterized protein n=1 Tax=Shinella granuli TaxID=323621 RepID=A0A4R2CQ98_SHIGR|nr:hypothetical protein [Shinella granuli]TCN41439.1 hypothetical protein EV665_11324 [Shinella granuli]